MARIVNNNLCKTNQAKVDRWLVKYKKSTQLSDEDYEYLESYLNGIIKRDSYSLKDCSEKNIVEFYLDYLTNLKDIQIYSDDFWNNVKEKVRKKLASKYTGHKTFDNNIDIYFNEVKAEYIKTPFNESNDLEFTEENYDVFIKNNLKLVIEVAKRYQNLGIQFDDLIQAGNEGLLTALKRYKKTKANLRVNMLNLLSQSDLTRFSYQDAYQLVNKAFTYSKNLEATVNKIPKNGFKSKFEFEIWIKDNIKPASFASVAFMWIRAYIIIELNQVSSLVHVPQSAQKTGTSIANIIRLDSINPHTDDCYHDNQTSKVTDEEFLIEDENLENIERQNIFKDLIDNSLYNLSNIERRIVKKRFGIDYPYELSINDIAENENLSVNKVKYILNNSLKKIANSIPERDKEVIHQLLS